MKLKLAVALGTVYLVWGSTYLAIAVADRSLPPLLMLSVRFLIAGGIMLAWAAWRGDLRGALPSRREWGAAAVVGLLLLVIDTGGVALAEQRVPTGQAALLIASVPLFTALLDRTFLKTKLPLGAVAGIGAGLLGVGLLVGTGGRIDPLGTAVLLVAAFAWSAGSLVARVAPLPRKPFVSAALQMLCGGVMLGVLGASAGEVSQVRLGAISPASLGAVAFLVVFGSIGAFTAFGWLLRHVSIPVLSTYSYVNPAVAVAPRLARHGRARRRQGDRGGARHPRVGRPSPLLPAPGAGRRADVGVAAALHPRQGRADQELPVGAAARRAARGSPPRTRRGATGARPSGGPTPSRRACAARR